MSIKLNLQFGWNNINRIAVKGSAFSKVKLTGKDFASYFYNVTDSKNFIDKVRFITGFFAVIINTHDKLFAAVDRIRSIPLFYALKNSDFYLSDNARWIWKQIGNPKPEPYSVAEFLLTGYVTGPGTLINEIKQLQAGEMLSYDEKTKELRVERYYRFIHRPIKGNKDEFLERLDNVIQNSIKRLIEYAGGREIVIPLSGGLDSRLIAMQLKKYGYDKLMAFSYGKPGNHEAEVSREVAEQLKIPWKFVPYSHELWREWHSSNEYKSYVKMADGLCSVAHIQDWPAVRELTQNKAITEGAVFVPGHSADFVAGSHIPPEFLYLKKVGLKKLDKAILHHHYCLTSFKSVAQTLKINEDIIKNYVENKIQQLVDDLSTTSVEDAVNAYEYWDWQERQAKFIVNSVRVYDFWGHDWWLPWWDKEFMEFWEIVPLYLRINKNLYDLYVDAIQNEAGIFLKKGKLTSLVFKSSLRNLVYKREMRSLIRKIYSIKRAVRVNYEYFNHPLAWYGITDINKFKQLLSWMGNINTILAFDQIKDIRKET